MLSAMTTGPDTLRTYLSSKESRPAKGHRKQANTVCCEGMRAALLLRRPQQRSNHAGG